MGKITTPLFLMCLLLFSCKIDEIGPQTDPLSAIEEGQLLISNEGLFNWGTASISRYDNLEETMYQQQYLAVNGQPMGDVLQSMLRHEDCLFFIMNNSQKILVTDLELELIHVIEGLDSPRYAAVVNESELWVTDLNANAVSVLSLENYGLITTIAMNAWTEEIFVLGEAVFIIEREEGFSSIEKIDPSTYSIMASYLPQGEGPYSFVQLDGNTMGILSNYAGDQDFFETYSFGAGPAAYSSEVLITQDAAFVAFNSTDNVLYLAGEELYQYDWTVNGSIESMGSLSNIETLYDIEYIAELDLILLADAKDYVSNGDMLAYTSNGELTFKRSVGSIPNGFLWLGEQ